jgi:hypothetical protein
MIRIHAANGTIAAKALGHQGSKHTQLGKTSAGKKTPHLRCCREPKNLNPKIPLTKS